jgi:hypothetical protein
MRIHGLNLRRTAQNLLRLSAGAFNKHSILSSLKHVRVSLMKTSGPQSRPFVSALTSRLYRVAVNPILALTGDFAIAPPNSSLNPSSTCHPTLPKSNDLSFAFGFNETGTNYAASTQRMLSSVNLIVTLFWSEDKEVEGALEEPASHLTCLWPIARSSQEFETMQPSGVAQVVSWSKSLMAVSVFLVCSFSLV